MIKNPELQKTIENTVGTVVDSLKDGKLNKTEITNIEKAAQSIENEVIKESLPESIREELSTSINGTSESEQTILDSIKNETTSKVQKEKPVKSTGGIANFLKKNLDKLESTIE